MNKQDGQEQMGKQKRHTEEQVNTMRVPSLCPKLIRGPIRKSPVLGGLRHRYFRKAA